MSTETDKVLGYKMKFKKIAPPPPKVLEDCGKFRRLPEFPGPSKSLPHRHRQGRNTGSKLLLKARVSLSKKKKKKKELKC